MLYLLYGQDTYRRDDRLREIIATYRARKDEALGLSAIDGAESIDAIGETLNAGGGLFEDKRFAIVRDAFMAHGGLVTTLLRDGNMAKRSDLNAVFVEGDIEKMKDFSAFRVLCRADKFSFLSQDRLGAWITRYVHDHGPEHGPRAIRREAVTLLVSLGPDLWHIVNELEKAMVYATGAREVTAGHLHAVVRFPKKETIFPVSDGLGDRKPLVALTAVARLTADGSDPDGIIGYAIGEARNLVRARFVLNEEKAAEGAKDFGVNPYVWKRRLEQAKQWSNEDAVGLLDRAAQLDRAWKTGFNKRLALDRFLLATP